MPSYEKFRKRWDLPQQLSKNRPRYAKLDVLSAGATEMN